MFNKVIDGILPEPRTVYEANDAYWNHYTSRQIRTSKFSKKVPVFLEVQCHLCGKQFMGTRWSLFHGACEEIAVVHAESRR